MCAGLIVFCVGLDASMGGGNVPDAETLQVRKRGFGPPVNLKGSFYQVTMIRKKQTTDDFWKNAITNMCQMYL